ncbi:hypothetical protein [Nocardioides ferulae]|uniref:hypothetical protein n=1 Tax=Nocardioides ferulae TaxID=2340821 RepID=UPI000EACD69E|nr:hypothetical protein [Nocardioides ferulae]
MTTTYAGTRHPLSPETARHEVEDAIEYVAPTADLDTIETDDPIWPAFGLDEQAFERFVQALVEHTHVPIEPADRPRLASLDSAVAFLVVASRTREPV